MRSCRFKLPRVTTDTFSPAAGVILFDPPDPVRLRYLTCGRPIDQDDPSPLRRQDAYGIESSRKDQSADTLAHIVPLVSSSLHILYLRPRTLMKCKGEPHTECSTRSRPLIRIVGPIVSPAISTFSHRGRMARRRVALPDNPALAASVHCLDPQHKENKHPGCQRYM